MAGTKVWTIGEVLTASALNGNFTKLPYASSAFTYTQAAVISPNSTAVTAVAFPASRFAVAPLVTVSTTDRYLTAYVSAITSGTATISGTSYNGVTRVGGGGNAPTVGTNSGYYAWTTSNANVYYQTASTGPAGYLSTNINMFVKTNGTVGSNSDAGNVVTIYTVWDEIPNGLTVSAGSATTVTIRPPEVTNIGNTWGTISISGTSSGS